MSEPISMSSVTDRMRSSMSGCVRSSASVRTSTACPARTASAVSASGPAFRASRTRLIPAAARRRAKQAPTPSDPPAIKAHGPYFSAEIMDEALLAQLVGHDRVALLGAVETVTTGCQYDVLFAVDLIAHRCRHARGGQGTFPQQLSCLQVERTE